MKFVRVSAAILACAMALAPGTASAQVRVITANASLGRSDLSVGQQFILTVEVSGTRALDRNPEFPDVSRFAMVLGNATTSSTRMVNGRTTVSIVIQYRLQATSVGSFEIGPVTVWANGIDVSTMPVTLTVTAEPPPSATPRPGTSRAIDDPVVRPEDLFLTAEVSSRQVLQNEPIIVEYRIYSRVNVTSYTISQLPPAAGFWVEEFDLPPRPEVREITRNGERFVTALIRKVAMFPTSPGKKTIESLAIEANVRVQRQRASDPSGDPFRGLLDRASIYDTEVPFATASPPVEVEVLPLPAAGRPRPFSGMVGHLSITTSLDRDSVAANQAVTMRVEVSGSGNLKAVAPPEIELPPTIEAFPPETSDRLRTTELGVTGTRTYEYVLIPRAPGVLTIPGIEVNYFAPDDGAYRTASAGPLELTVSGRASEAALPGSRARGEVEALRSDIRFIEIDTPRFERTGSSPLASRWFWLLLLGPAGVVGGAVGLRRRRDRLTGDVALARSRRAGRVAKRRLSKARELAAGDDPRAFYAETGRALTGFVADRLNVAAAGMIRDDIRPALETMGASDATISEYLACVDASDRQRFSPAASDDAERRAFLDRVATAMADLDRGLGR
ncbi:MAG: BatD family protein [Gemmatimonadota bacterium]